MKTYDAQEAATYGFNRQTLQEMATHATSVAFWLRRLAAECCDADRRADLVADADEYAELNAALNKIIAAHDQGRQAEAA